MKYREKKKEEKKETAKSIKIYVHSFEFKTDVPASLS